MTEQEARSMHETPDSHPTFSNNNVMMYPYSMYANNMTMPWMSPTMVVYHSPFVSPYLMMMPQQAPSYSCMECQQRYMEYLRFLQETKNKIPIVEKTDANNTEDKMDDL